MSTTSPAWSVYVLLSADGVPPWAGTLVLEDATVTLRGAPGAEITLEDEPVDERVLRDDADGQPDVLAVGQMRFYVIRRDEKTYGGTSVFRDCAVVVDHRLAG